MKFESELEVRQIQNILDGLKKVQLGAVTMPEALGIIKAADFLQKQVATFYAPKPQGVISTDELGKKVMPMKAPEKKK